MKDQQFVESVKFAGAEFSEDDSGRVIRNVALLGPISKNKRRYSVEGMGRAVGLYNGVQCFVNHPTPEEERTGRRDVMKIAGVVENARMDGDKIKGDMRLLADDYGQKFYNIARTMPHAASCSHVAIGRSIKKDGQEVVEEISKVLSVDLVANGATTQSVFEDHCKEKGMEWADIKLEDLRTSRPDIANALKAEGSKSRDDEVEKLKTENADLKKKVDEAQVKEATAKRTARVAELLAESKLPETAITDTFKEMLYGCTGDDFEVKVKAMIEDRKGLVGGVKNMGGTKKITETQGGGKLQATEIAKAVLAG